MCVQKSSGGVVFWCKILEKIFRQKKCVFFLECPSTDEKTHKIRAYGCTTTTTTTRMERWSAKNTQKPTTTRGRDETTPTTTTTTTTRDRDATLWSIFFWCSQNQCVSSSSFRSLLLESFSLRFVDVRLCTRDATWSIFVGVTKLFLFVVSLFAF